MVIVHLLNCIHQSYLIPEQMAYGCHLKPQCHRSTSRLLFVRHFITRTHTNSSKQFPISTGEYIQLKSYFDLIIYIPIVDVPGFISQILLAAASLTQVFIGNMMKVFGNLQQTKRPCLFITTNSLFVFELPVWTKILLLWMTASAFWY